MAGKNILFTFEDLSTKDRATRTAVRYFARAGATVVAQDVSAGTKRTSGVSYRELTLYFADSQTVVLRIKQTGDIYQVVLNGKVLPIKSQEDHPAAISEVVKAMDAGRTAFQKKLAAAQVKMPQGIKTAAPKMKEALTAKRDSLKVAIEDVRGQIEAARAA
jgi:hypothetical protein